MKNISELISRIRDFINNPRKQYKLLQNHISWYQLCSSLDVIQDTEAAIDSYINKKYPKDSGSKYLLVYGVLQSLFLQQDAVKHLAESLNIEYQIDNLLWQIRITRNESIGHPTKMIKKRKDNQASHFISGITLRKEGFTLVSYNSNDSGPRLKEINIYSLIKDQKKIHFDILKRFIDMLILEDKMHKEKYKSENLINIFPQSINYDIGKLYEACFDSDNTVRIKFGEMHLKIIRSYINKFKAALLNREILPAYDSVAYDINEIEYPLNELKEYFKKPKESYLNNSSARIFIHFINDKFNLLKKHAEEFDNEYQNI